MWGGTVAMEKVLVLGGGGMLGHKLCQLLPALGFEVATTVRRDPGEYRRFRTVFDDVTIIPGVDALDDASINRALREFDPQAIVNCVGIIKQLKEAHDPLVSVGINSYLPHRLAKICEQQERKLIHISTDCVFNGKKGNYREDNPSDAEDLYGKSKFLGETLDNEPAALTLRTSIIGRELTEPGHGLLEWFLSQQGKKVRGFSRAIYTGFTTHELANVIAMVIRKHPRLSGLCQVASEPINKYDLLCLIREVYGVSIEIDRDEAFAIDRSMVMDRFPRETGYVPPDWASMIRAMHDDPTPYAEWKQDWRELEAKWRNHAFRSC